MAIASNHIHTEKLSHARDHSGFTLIEVLVALLILAIGILGITALQFKGLKFNNDAYIRSQINFLAYDIADRMRLRPNEAADYASNLINYSVTATQPTGCDQTGTAAVGYQNDLDCWKLLLHDNLPPGTVANINDDGDGLFTVSINWTDRESQSHNISYTFQP